MIKEKLRHDPDSEIATTSLRVSLLCPLGKMRISLPCRANTCSHLQCFDASIFLQMNEKKPTWTCPVCDKAAHFDALNIDGLFSEIFSKCPTDCEDIQFSEDSSWKPLSLKSADSEAFLVSSPSVNKGKKDVPDIIDLTCDSSSDEDDEPPVQRARLSSPSSSSGSPPPKRVCLDSSSCSPSENSSDTRSNPSSPLLPLSPRLPPSPCVPLSPPRLRSPPRLLSSPRQPSSPRLPSSSPQLTTTTPVLPKLPKLGLPNSSMGLPSYLLPTVDLERLVSTYVTSSSSSLTRTSSAAVSRTSSSSAARTSSMPVLPPLLSSVPPLMQSSSMFSSSSSFYNPGMDILSGFFPPDLDRLPSAPSSDFDSPIGSLNTSSLPSALFAQPSNNSTSSSSTSGPDVISLD